MGDGGHGGDGAHDAPGTSPEVLPEVLRGPGEDERRLRRAAQPLRRSPEMQAIGVGLEFAGMVGGACLFGFLFDHWRGTAPLGLAIGGGVGVVVGGYHAVRSALTLGRRMDAWERDRRASGSEETRP